MEKSHLYSFSAPGNYRFIIFGNSQAQNLSFENWQISNTENTSGGVIISAEKTLRDQAHLLSFIITLNQNHLTIILIEKLKPEIT